MELGEVLIVKPNSTELSKNQSDEPVFFIVDEMPLFKGMSFNNFRQYIQQNMRYPSDCAKKGIQGRVFVQFVVNKEGYVQDIQIVRGVAPCLDEEAIRVVQSSPRWTPGRHKGKAVNVEFIFPMVFKLN